nr:retrovirus-related Pol polyprotein from transposon TNT 1-94 [Tanacetum cinerariifolium]
MAAVNSVPQLVDKKGELVIRCETSKATWNDLVHSFKGTSATKENKIIDLKLEYQTFRAKPIEILSQAYTRYKTLLNELANDGVNLFKHEINDFQENSDDEVDERSSEEYLRDLDIVFHDRDLLVKVLMALADDELTVGKNHARNGKLIDITMRKVSQSISEQIPHQKKKVVGGELFSSFEMNENENLFVPASMGYDQEMVIKTKDWVERLNPNSKLQYFNTRRILVPEIKAVNESLKPTKKLNTPESSKDSKAESLTPLPPLKNLQEASPSLEVMQLTFHSHSSKERPGLGIMKHTKHKTQDSLNKCVLGPVTVSETEQNKPSVPIEVKDTKQE